jgi:hypothetical protein
MTSPYVPLSLLLQQETKTKEQGTYLNPSLQFSSCSYAASTTAQYVSTSTFTTECFEKCADYPVTYIFPGAGGYNCYCAMTSNGAGQAACGVNTFYAYSRKTELRRRTSR